MNGGKGIPARAARWPEVAKGGQQLGVTDGVEEGGVAVLGAAFGGEGRAPLDGRVRRERGQPLTDGVVEFGGPYVDVYLGLKLAPLSGDAAVVEACMQRIVGACTTGCGGPTPGFSPPPSPADTPRSDRGVSRWSWSTSSAVAPEGDRGRGLQLPPMIEGLQRADVPVRAPGARSDDDRNDASACGLDLLDQRKLVVHDEPGSKVVRADEKQDDVGPANLVENATFPRLADLEASVEPDAYVARCLELA